MVINETIEKSYFQLSLTTDTETQTIRFIEGEPEDNTFSRDLNDAYAISGLLEAAYSAGLRGETLEHFIKEDEEDEDEGESEI